MNYLAYLLFLFSSISLQAVWNPDYVSKSNQILNEPAVVQLEQRIIKELKNSWCSEEKARLILELIILTRPSVCVEIGAFTGSCTLPMLTGLKYLGHGHGYVVDAWSNQEAIRGLPKEDPNIAWWRNLDMQSVKREFIHKMTSWSLTPYYKLLHMSSQQAVSKIPRIDFLHLDGNFSVEGALLDSQLYLPKVVSGGYILLSNALVMVGKQATKMKALWPLFDQCDFICDIEGGNALLFKKN